MAHRASFDKRIPIGLAIAGSLGVALYLGYRKYKASAQDSPKSDDAETSKKEVSAAPKTESSGQRDKPSPSGPAKPTVSQLPKPVKSEPPNPPPKPQVPKREPEVAQPAAPEPKPAAPEPKPAAPEPKPAAPEPKPAAQPEKKPIPPPIETDLIAPEVSKPVHATPPKPEVPITVEPLSPKHRAEMASTTEVQLESPKDQADAPLKSEAQITLSPQSSGPAAQPEPPKAGNDPLISLESWGDLALSTESSLQPHIEEKPAQPDGPPSDTGPIIPTSVTADVKSDTNSNVVGDQDKDKPSFPESDNRENQAPQDLPSPISLKSWGDLLSSGPQEILSPLRSLESSTYSLDSSLEVDRQDLHDTEDASPTSSDTTSNNHFGLLDENGHSNSKSTHKLSPRNADQSSTKRDTEARAFNTNDTSTAQKGTFDETDSETSQTKLNSQALTEQIPIKDPKSVDYEIMQKSVRSVKFESEDDTVFETDTVSPDKDGPVLVGETLMKKNGSADVSKTSNKKDAIAGEVLVESKKKENGSVNLSDVRHDDSEKVATEVVLDDYISPVGSDSKVENIESEGEMNNNRKMSNTCSIDSLISVEMQGTEPATPDFEREQSHLMSSTSSSIDNSYIMVNAGSVQLKRGIDEAMELNKSESEQSGPLKKIKTSNQEKSVQRSESINSVDSLENGSAPQEPPEKIPEPEIYSSGNLESRADKDQTVPVIKKSLVESSTHSLDSLENESDRNGRSYADALKSGIGSADALKTVAASTDEVRPSSAGSLAASDPTGMEAGSKDSLDSPFSVDLNASTSSLLSSPETTHYWSTEKGTGEPSWTTRSLSRNSDSFSSIDSLELRQRGESVSSTENSPFTTPHLARSTKVSSSTDSSRDDEPKPTVISLRWKSKGDTGREVTILKEVVDLGMQIVTTTGEDGVYNHQVFEVRRNGPAHRMALRNKDILLRLNGMPVGRWSHDILLEQIRLLSESEFVMTVQREVQNTMVLKNLQTRVRKTKRGIAVAGEVTDVAENQLPNVKDMQVASSSGVDNPCQCMITSEDASRYLCVRGHRLRLLPKEDKDTFLFSRHLFTCTSKSPTSPSSKTPPAPMFLVVLSGWVAVTKAAYVTVVGRNQLSLMITSLHQTAKESSSKWSSVRKRSKLTRNSDSRSSIWNKCQCPVCAMYMKYYPLELVRKLLNVLQCGNWNEWICKWSDLLHFVLDNFVLSTKHFMRSMYNEEESACNRFHLKDETTCHLYLKSNRAFPCNLLLILVYYKLYISLTKFYTFCFSYSFMAVSIINGFCFESLRFIQQN